MELVGIYHAGYKGHGALNVVVGIDQLGLHGKKRRVPRSLTSAARRRGRGRAARIRTRWRGHAALFDFGGLFVQRRETDTALLYHLYSRQFPLDDRRIVVIEDLPKPAPSATVGCGCSATGWRVAANRPRATSTSSRVARSASGPRTSTTAGRCRPGVGGRAPRRDLARALSRRPHRARPGRLPWTPPSVSVGHDTRAAGTLAPRPRLRRTVLPTKGTPAPLTAAPDLPACRDTLGASSARARRRGGPQIPRIAPEDPAAPRNAAPGADHSRHRA
jgi:hypothetical protein